MKKVLFFILSVLLSFGLSGCGGNEDVEFPTGEDLKNDDGTVSIEFYGWGSAEEYTVYQELVNEFMVQNPNIKVSYTNSSPENYMRVLQNRVNNLPDVFYLPDTDFMQWVDAGRLLNINSQIKSTQVEKVWPEAINRYKYDRENQVLGTGNIYALPKDLGPFTLVYNKTLFDKINEEKGLNLEHPDLNVPMNWAEFVDLLEKLKYQDGKKIYGITHYELNTAVYSNNANYFKDDTRTQAITDKNFYNALQWVADLHLKHDVMPSPDEQQSINGFQRFSTGGAVFSFMGPWDQKGFWENLSFDWDLIPVPVGSDSSGNVTEGAKSTTWVGSMGFAISAKTKRANAAYKLAEFLSLSESSQRMSYTLGQSIPNIIEMAEKDYVNNVGLEGVKTTPENKQQFLNIVKGNEYVTGKARPQYYTYDSIWYGDFMTELTDIWLGNVTAKEFCEDYAQELQEALDESYSYIEQ